jgi:hypothetical protein
VSARYKISEPPTATERFFEEVLEIRLKPDQGRTRRHSQKSTKRAFAAGEIEALAEATGEFEVAGRYADLSTDAPFDQAHNPDRLILALRRIGGRS